MINNQVVIGIICISLYNLFAGFNDVYLGNLVQEFNPFAILFVSFLITHIFFNILQYKNLQQNLKQLININVISLNIATTVSWISSSWAFKFLEPAVLVAIVLPMGPILTQFLGPIFKVSTKPTNKSIIYPVLIILISFLFIYITYYGKTAVGYVSIENIFFASILILLTTVALAFQSIYSKILSSQNLKPSQILSIRFYFVIIVSFFLSPNGEIIKIILWDKYLNIIFFSLVGFIMPMYFYQVAIKKLSVKIVALIIATGPFFTLFLELFDRRLNLSLISMICIFVSVTVTIINIKYEYSFEKCKTIV